MKVLAHGLIWPLRQEKTLARSPTVGEAGQSMKG